MVAMDEISFDDIRRLKDGDKSIFNRIIAVYKNRVAGLCFKYMRNTEEASDMSQEVFAQLYASIGSFAFKSSFSTWVYRVTVNSCTNRLKALKRRRVIEPAAAREEDEKEREAETLADRGRLQDEELEQKEIRDAVMDALKDFPEKDRTLIILRDMEGVPCEEISKALDMPLGSVKSRTARAREKLRKILKNKLEPKT